MRTLAALLALGLAAPGLATPTANPIRRMVEEARARLEGREGPREGVALATLSGLRLQEGDRRGALEAARSGYELVKERDGPEAADAALRLGDAFAALEEEALARLAYQRALRADPEGPLVDDARDQLARLEARGLPAPASFRETVKAFLLQDPLTLDEDAMIYFLGFSRGLRILQVEKALARLEEVWTGTPEGDRVGRALLHAALIRGFVLEERTQARELLDRLQAMRPHSGLLGMTVLARAFLHLAEGNLEDAVAAVSAMPPEDDRSRDGALLGAMLSGYYLGDSARAYRFLDHITRRPGPFMGLAEYHRALLLLARDRDLAASREALGRAAVEKDVPEGWVQTLRGALDRIEGAKDPLERDFRFARFFERIGHYPRAKTEYEALARAHPESLIGAKARLRIAALDQDDRGELTTHRPALEDLARDDRLSPALHAEARWRLARTRLAQGVSPSRAFEGGIDGKDPFSLPAMRGLLLHSDSTDPERIQILRELSEELDAADPSRPRVLRALGDALGSAGDTAGALRVRQQLLADDPRVAPVIHRTMDQLRIEALSPEGEDPSDPEALVRLALLHLRRGELDRAESLLEGARRATVNRPPPGARAPTPRPRRENPVAKEGPAAETPPDEGRPRRRRRRRDRAPEPDEEPTLLVGDPAPGGDPDVAVAAARASAYLARLLALRGARPERIREALEDALSRDALPLRDRYTLLELKARRVEGDDPEEARAIRRALVRYGYRIRALLPGLVREEAEANGPQAALSLFRHLVGSLEPDPGLTALAAELYEELEMPLRARDARVRLAKQWPTSVEGKAAREALAADEAQRLRRALLSPLPEERKLEALVTFMERVPADLRAAHRLVLDDFVAQDREETAAQGMSGRLALELGRVYAQALGDPARAAELLRRARDSRPEDPAQVRIELARAQAASGDLRGALGTYEEVEAYGDPIRSQALYERAGLLERQFQDPAAALALVMEALRGDFASEATLAEAALTVARLMQATGSPPRTIATELARWAPKIQAPELRTPLLTRLAEIYEEVDDPARAGDEWIRVADTLDEITRKGPAFLRGIRNLYAARRFDAVSTRARSFLEEYPDAEGLEEIRGLLRKASAQLTVRTLLASVDWSDPESKTNLSRIFRAAKLLVNPLEDYRAAATQIHELIELFPGSKESREARALLRKLPLLEAAGAGSLQGPGGEEAAPGEGPRPEDRLAAARFLEYRLGDRERAAGAYRKLFEEEDGLIGLYAGIALLRVLTLQPGDPAAAREVAATLRSRPVPPALQGRLRGRLAALAHRDEWNRLEARARRGTDRDAALVRMVELAARVYQDSPLAMGALERIQDRTTQVRAALDAAEVLEPGAAPAPEAPGPLRFLDLAVQAAPTDALRARAHLARGVWHERWSAPRHALVDFRTAAGLAKGEPLEEEALYRKAKLLLRLGEAPEEALKALETVEDRFPGGDRYLLASTRAPALAKEIQARKLDERAAREGVRDPGIYFHTARLLAERYDALPEALENYRTYIRVGDRPEQIVRSYLEGAEVLVRLQKPEEALLMLERLESQPSLPFEAPDVQLRIGKVHEFERADLASAREIYTSILARHGGTEAAREAKKGIERIDGLAEADARADEALESGGNFGELAAIEAEYLKGRRKDYRAAAEALRAAIDRSRDREKTARLYLELATIEDKNLQRMRDAAEAYEGYLEHSQRGKDQAAALLRVADIYQNSLKDPKRAHEHYARFLKTYHSHAARVGALLSNARTLEDLNRVQEAIQIYQNVIDSFPRSGSDAAALDRLAFLKRTYFASFREAVNAYRELISRFPFNPLADDAQYSIARIFEIELGDLVQARSEYETLLVRYPSSEWYGRAQQALARIARN